jgi:hypothetical protein
MLKRGRKSTAELATVASLIQARPAAPDALTASQRAVWEDTVVRLPADWFPRETHRLLAEYCKATIRAEFIGREVDRFTTGWLGEEGGVERLGKLTATLDRQVRMMGALARALRITNQSRFRPETAARKAGGSWDGSTPRPWDVDT